MNKRSIGKFSTAVIVLCLAGFVSLTVALSRQGTPDGEAGNEASVNIGCLVSDEELEKTLEDISARNGLKMIYTPAFSEGLASRQCAAFVIDRSRVITGWSEYAAFITQYKIDTPLLVVDSIGEWLREPRDT